MPTRPPWLLAALLALPGLAAAVEPQQVQQTAARLGDARLDTGRAFDADGQVFERPGMIARFESGRFWPIARDDGRVEGLVFFGGGTVELLIPPGSETTAWQVGTSFAPMLQEVSAMVLWASDGSDLELRGDRPWNDAGDPTGAVFRAWESRRALLAHPRWDRLHPQLDLDRLEDLYGGGSDGGHVLAEFRAGDDWISYLHNPRGALLRGESTAVYTARGGQQVPPRVDVLASWGDATAGARWDMAAIDLDVSFPTSGANDRNLVVGEVTAQLDLVALPGDRPVRTVQLELADRRLLCNATPGDIDLRVTAAYDEAGTALAVVRRQGRALVVLDRALAPGESTRLTLSYRGPMTQGLKAAQPDVYYSPLGPWAWYPRPARPDDRYASRVSLHLPRFLSGVAPGALVEERKEKDGWHFVWAEPAGVRNITVVVGDLVRSKPADAGEDPAITVWMGSTEADGIPGAARSARGLVDFVAALWGEFPYSALHIVEALPFPDRNWQMGDDGTVGAWSCVPPGQLDPWQGFAETPSGMLLAAMPVTAPSYDLPQARNLARLLTDPLEANRFLRVADLARQWWGHLVPPRTERDVWIGEAIAHWTALLYVSQAVGADAMQQHTLAMQTAMAQAASEAQPIAHGARLGARFAPQVWGRGPLLVQWLVEAMRAAPFGQAMQQLMQRGAARGVDYALLRASISPFAPAYVEEALDALTQTNALPALRWRTAIDRDGRVGVTVAPFEGAAPVDLRIDLVYGLKEKEARWLHVPPEGLSLVIQAPKKPRRVAVDPQHTALVAELKRDNSLEVALDAAAVEPEESE